METNKTLVIHLRKLIQGGELSKKQESIITEVIKLLSSLNEEDMRYAIELLAKDYFLLEILSIESTKLKTLLDGM